MSIILTPTQENINKVAEALRKSEVIGFPTETVYGLAGNAYDPVALTRIFESKQRPKFDPLIVHIHSSLGSLEALSEAKLIQLDLLSDVQQNQLRILISHFWPGPLTLILPKHPQIPDLVTSGLPTVGIRMPNHPVAQELLKACGLPLAAPSANRFGRISPTSAQAVQEELGETIPWILDGGDSTIGLESTVLGFGSSGALQIFRPGGIPKELLEKTLGIALPTALSSSNPRSPGMLLSHYAPTKPLRILPSRIADLPEILTQMELKSLASLASRSPKVSIGLLVFQPHPKVDLYSKRIRFPVVSRSLSQTGNLGECARHLFSELRALDQSPVEMIFAEPCPSQEGLGFAISDRLKRASAVE